MLHNLYNKINELSQLFCRLMCKNIVCLVLINESVFYCVAEYSETSVHRCVVFPRQSFRIFGHDPQYFLNDHFWDKKLRNKT
jgi:hypothetical protein